MAFFFLGYKSFCPFLLPARLTGLCRVPHYSFFIWFRPGAFFFSFVWFICYVPFMLLASGTAVEETLPFPWPHFCPECPA